MTDLLTFMHIYIIIFKESDLYYSQLIVKYNILPLSCKKDSVMCRMPQLVHSYVKCKKRSRKLLALIARKRADHTHLCNVVVFVRPLQKCICEPQTRNALQTLDGRQDCEGQ